MIIIMITFMRVSLSFIERKAFLTFVEQRVPHCSLRFSLTESKAS